MSFIAGLPFSSKVDEQELGAPLEVVDPELLGEDPAQFQIAALTRDLDSGMTTRIDLSDPGGVKERFKELLEQHRRKKIRLEPKSVILENGEGLDTILDGSQINGGAIKPQTITGDMFPENSIHGSRIQDGTIPESKYGEGSVSQRALGEGAVGPDQIQADAVTTPKVKDLSITLGKLDPELQAILLNNQGQGGGILGGTTAIKAMPSGGGNLIRGGFDFAPLTSTLTNMPEGSWLYTSTDVLDDKPGASAGGSPSSIGGGFLRITGTANGSPLLLVYKIHGDEMRFADLTADNIELVGEDISILTYSIAFTLSYEVRVIRSAAPNIGIMAAVTSQGDVGSYDGFATSEFGKMRGRTGKFMDTFLVSRVKHLVDLSGDEVGLLAEEVGGRFIMFLLQLVGDGDTLLEIGNIRAEPFGRYPNENYRNIHFPLAGP